MICGVDVEVRPLPRAPVLSILKMQQRERRAGIAYERASRGDSRLRGDRPSVTA